MKQKYNIDELFVATVCPVSINSKGNHITKEKTEKFYAVVVKDHYKRYFDLVSGKKYHHFDNSSFEFIERNLDDFYVIKLVMMRKHLKKNISELSIDEIIFISNELNGIVDVPKLAIEEKNDDVDTINDYFLKEIIKTSAKIDDSIDSLYKEELINELRKLAEEYVDMVINISDGKLTLGNSVFEARQLCIKKLVDIEAKIERYKSNMTSSNDLVNDLKKLKLQLDNCKRK